MIPMELKLVPLEVPEGGNLILGQTHFIKSVEDIYEAMVTTVPQMKFGIAFNEASGPCLTRVDGNDEELKSLAARNAGPAPAGGGGGKRTGARRAGCDRRLPAEGRRDRRRRGNAAWMSEDDRI